MKSFAQPTVGSRVTVTTRYPTHYYYATKPYEESTYEGEVGHPARFVPDGSFMLLTPQDQNMPTRVISLARVVKMRYADGSAVKKVTANNQVRVYQVQGSRGNVYTVTERGKDKSCTCTGFQFRKMCKHTKE